MTKADDRIDDLKDAIKTIDDRVKTLEDKMGQTREEALTSKSELKDLIVEAVEKGNGTIFLEINKMKKDIEMLKDKEGKKAIFFLKTVIVTSITVTVGWIVTGFLNNYASITTDAIRNNINSEEVVVSENNNN